MVRFRAEAAVFDLDNTLYDERQYFSLSFKSIAQRLAQACGREPEELHRFLDASFREKGSRYPKFFRYVLEELGIYTDELDGEVLQIYKTAKGRLSLHPDATQLLGSLHGKVKLGLITNGLVEAQSNKVKLLGVEHYFDNVCYARALGLENEKPSQLPFAHTLTAMGVSPVKSVYIGDDPTTDIAGAWALGMFVVRLRRGEFANVDSPKETVPHLEIRSLSELTDHIDFGGKA